MLLKIMSALHDIGLTIEGMFRFLPDLEHWPAPSSMVPTVAERGNLLDMGTDNDTRFQNYGKQCRQNTQKQVFIHDFPCLQQNYVHRPIITSKGFPIFT